MLFKTNVAVVGAVLVCVGTILSWTLLSKHAIMPFGCASSLARASISAAAGDEVVKIWNSVDALRTEVSEREFELAVTNTC